MAGEAEQTEPGDTPGGGAEGPEADAPRTDVVTGSAEGHRKRLRERYLRTGTKGFEERDALELLLTFAVPRVDVRGTAIALLERFGSLAAVFSQPPDMLTLIPGVGRATSVLLSLVPQIWAMSLRPRTGARLDSTAGVREYIRASMGLQRRERLVALLVDSSGRLLAERELEHGTVDRASVHPRNLLEKVIATNATGVILVHNHPGGRPEPSPEDLALTARLCELGRSLGFRVLDHLIATDAGVTSLRERGAIPHGS